MQTDPNAVIGGLYDPPQGFGPLLLGTDNEGQSVIANLVYGTRTSLIVGLLAGSLATVIGLAIGLIAGYPRRLGRRHPDGRRPTSLLAIPGIVVVILFSIALNNRSDLHAWRWSSASPRWPWTGPGGPGPGHQRADPGTHRRRPAVRGALLVDPRLGRAAVPARRTS